jgi:hypothetical protein
LNYIKHPSWCQNSMSNLCVLFHSHFRSCRAIHSISPYHSMILIPGWRPHQFMFLIALGLVKLWIPSLRYSFKIMFIECYIWKLQYIGSDFVIFFFLFGLWNFVAGLVIDSYMSGVHLTQTGLQGIALCLQHVKHTRLCPRV